MMLGAEGNGRHVFFWCWMGGGNEKTLAEVTVDYDYFVEFTSSSLLLSFNLARILHLLHLFFSDHLVIDH